MKIKKAAKLNFSSLRGQIIGNYAIKGVAMLLSILTVPAYLSYFSSQGEVGVWFTISSVLNWVLLFDFGIGGGLRNRIVAPLCNNDRLQVSRLLSSAYVSTFVIIVVLMMSATLLVPHVDWTILVGGEGAFADNTYLSQVILILLYGIIFRLFSVLVSHLLYALQKAVVPNALIVSSNALILAFLLVSNAFGARFGAYELAIFTSVANNLPALVVTVYVFARHFPWYRPRFSDVTKPLVRSLLSVGGLILYLQIVIAFIFNIKELLITWLVGSAQVVDYQIYYKIIGTIGGLFSLALTPIWSAATKAQAEGNSGYLKRLYGKGRKAVVAMSVLQLLAIPLLQPVVNVWLGASAIEVNPVYALIFCLYNSIYMWVMLHYNLCCGLNLFKGMVISLTLGSIANIFLAMLFCQFKASWAMVVFATAIALIPSALTLPISLEKAIAKSSGGGWSSE